MNTARFTDDKIHAYEMNNAAFWRERYADHFTYDYGDYYRKPRISYRPLPAALVCAAIAMCIVYFLAGVLAQ